MNEKYFHCKNQNLPLMPSLQGAKWFPGRVIEFRDSLYSLEYDDGDIETEVQRHFLRLESQLRPHSLPAGRTNHCRSATYLP